MDESKRQRLMKKIESHLRTTARKLVKFNTEGEALQYLVTSFRAELECDLIAIVLKEGDDVVPTLYQGDFRRGISHPPIAITSCLPRLFEGSTTFQEVDEACTCRLIDLLRRNGIKTWFSVPIKDEENEYGICMIGFRRYVSLLAEARQLFDDFGEDVALAITVAKKNESQRRKMVGLEWLAQHFSLDTPLERFVEKIVERAGKGTNAGGACMYLYREEDDSFVFHPPAYGKVSGPQQIMMKNNYRVSDYFPFLEKPGGDQLTVPLVVNFKTIGVLHVERKNEGTFTKEDVGILDMLANYVAVMLENVRLYQQERDHTHRLRLLLQYQQKLMKETIRYENFHGITKTFSQMFGKAVIVFDRFTRPIAYELGRLSEQQLQDIANEALRQAVGQSRMGGYILLDGWPDVSLTVWPINSGGDVVGYLAIDVHPQEIDDFFRLSVELALNIFSIQFMKQKLVFDTREQLKDSFLHKLLTAEIEEEESIIQYANVFQWNIFDEHRIAVLYLQFSESEEQVDLFKRNVERTALWDRLKARIAIEDPALLYGAIDDRYILIVPASKERKQPAKYWNEWHHRINEWMKEEGASCRALLGIGGRTASIRDYYFCYQQAVQALQVILHSFQGTSLAFFDELGAYTVLHHLKELEAAKLFVDKYLGPLIRHSAERNVDWLQTIRVFLDCNGHLTETAEKLYIHRSTLQYRLEKIEEMLGFSLGGAEQRFNLMMALKLYDLYGLSSAKSLKR
ncbi:helix-turn-helix domain-containing protein [Geobacillus subterraneus]|uniref:helix-turn-helix domain-containing protein n=1 Tax=Geobacillus subterraneus TaxID=129338 RepID=UPI002AC9DD9A|nr:helix-turn-helix domain-containing protein [Geobacillus subterraneus]WPZ19740.1 helix-turn-helix domain-containing protein [Geobacillus subterraneus]